MAFGLRARRWTTSNLYDFVLERELSRSGDLELAERAVEAIENGIAALSFSPFTCRKAGADPFPPRACDPFGGSGYVALSENETSDSIVIAAVRHEREDDYH